jgi:hypothetical protein
MPSAQAGEDRPDLGGKILLDRLLDAGIEKFRVRRGVEVAVEVAGVIQDADIEFRRRLPLDQRQQAPGIVLQHVPVIVDPELQYAAKDENAPRYRVKNNLPGTPAFCPLVFRTEALDSFISLNLPDRAREAVADVPRDLLARTAAFLLLKDSRASFDRASPTALPRPGSGQTVITGRGCSPCALMIRFAEFTTTQYTTTTAPPGTCRRGRSSSAPPALALLRWLRLAGRLKQHPVTEPPTLTASGRPVGAELERDDDMSAKTTDSVRKGS